MTIAEYFNEIQEIIKSGLDNPEEVNNIIAYLNDDNIQAIISQNFNNKKAPNEVSDIILRMYDKGDKVENPDNQTLAGERGENVMEHILSYKEFKKKKL